MQPLTYLLGHSLDVIFANGQMTDISNLKTTESESVKLYFSNGVKLTVSSDDDPHFWGDAELISQIENDEVASGDLAKNIETEVTAIRVWKWKVNGVNILSSGRVCQITFFNKANVLCALGLTCQVTDYEKLLPTGTVQLGVNDLNMSLADGPIEYEDIVSV